MTKITSTDGTSLADQFDAVARGQGLSDGNFANLMAQVVGESGLKPNAVNKATGAAGPFQFIKSTWLALLRNHGAELGVKPDLVQQIKLDAKGHPSVRDPQALQTILDLRHDVALSAAVAGKLHAENRNFLHHSLGRQPSDTEIHLAFVLGATGATHLIRAAAATPQVSSDTVVGAAATSNPGLFTDHDGKMRSAADAVSFIGKKFTADRAKVSAYIQLSAGAPKTGLDA